MAGPKTHDQASAAQESFSQQLLAAVDLGSNSFHLVLARVVNGHLQTIEKRGEKVQLAAGLNEKMAISPEAEGRALECLERFSQRLKGLPRASVTILGTNTLRAASNSAEFISKANKILGYHIEVIAGIEEARLIYLGVAHTLADDQGKRLVIDIGGGSTEFIIGERFAPIELESLEMGCVSYTDKYFASKTLSQANFDCASNAAQQEIQRIQNRYQKLGWQNVVGSSGTIRAASRVLYTYGLTEGSITLKGLKDLRKLMINQVHLDNLMLQGVKDQRLRVFPAGIAILIGIFEALGIREMHYSDGALREGALYDLLGRATHEDVREKTVYAMQSRYAVDLTHSHTVKETSLALFESVKSSWKLDSEEHKDWLRWSADLFEIGLSVAHSQFHRHGAYLIEHSDMPGFTKRAQSQLALLVLGHRRKIPVADINYLPPAASILTLKLLVLLRVSILLHHGRGTDEVNIPQVISDDIHSVRLIFDVGYLAAHPMTEMDLKMEREYLEAVGIDLMF